jgi:hypothetical protein|tara:strand:- start:453 stop:671 length:219 start_codon:yes stop_codon:yes gene_type:complete
MIFNMFSPENQSNFSRPVRDVVYGWWILGIPGYMFDTTGSYTVPFAMFATLGFSGAILMLFVKKPGREPRSL